MNQIGSARRGYADRRPSPVSRLEEPKKHLPRHAKICQAPVPCRSTPNSNGEEFVLRLRRTRWPCAARQRRLHLHSHSPLIATHGQQKALTMSTSTPIGPRARSPTLAPAVLPQPSEEIDEEMATEMGTSSRSISRAPVPPSTTPRHGARSPPPQTERPQVIDQEQTVLPNAASEMGSTVGDGDGDGDFNNDEKTADIEAQQEREPDIYDRFTPEKKNMIVAIVSFAAFIGRKWSECSGSDTQPLPLRPFCRVSMSWQRTCIQPRR